MPESAGLSEEANDERKAARKAFFPSSIGLSFLAAGTCRELAVTARWGDYVQVHIEEGDGDKASVWRRIPREEVLTIPLNGGSAPVVRDVPGSRGLQLHVAERPIDAIGLSGAQLPAGTRSVSCFVVNRRPPDEAQPDRAYAFQAEIEVRTDEGFVPRPDLRGAHAGDWDDRVADLHYADTPEYAAGHGVSAEWELVDGECRSIRIQDELHLIAGPLGTMAGLYETAIEALAVREVDGRRIKPKIVASTATARRAQDQVQALFARPTTHVFPPAGPDRRDTFFARTVPSSETPALFLTPPAADDELGAVSDLGRLRGGAVPSGALLCAGAVGRGAVGPKRRWQRRGPGSADRKGDLDLPGARSPDRSRPDVGGNAGHAAAAAQERPEAG